MWEGRWGSGNAFTYCSWGHSQVFLLIVFTPWIRQNIDCHCSDLLFNHSTVLSCMDYYEGTGSHSQCCIHEFWITVTPKHYLFNSIIVTVMQLYISQLSVMEANMPYDKNQALYQSVNNYIVKQAHILSCAFSQALKLSQSSWGHLSVICPVFVYKHYACLVSLISLGLTNRN